MLTIHRVLKFIVLSLSMSYLPSRADSQTCPPAPTSVDPSVSTRVSHDPSSQTYDYHYRVNSQNDSVLSINYFTLSLAIQPLTVGSPNAWISRYVSLSTVPPNLRWATIAPGPNSAPDIGGANLPAPAFAIQPGGHLDGFGLQSSRPPGIVQYYVQGFTQVPTSSPSQEDDEPEPDCAGWDFHSPRFQTLVTGIATGPSSPSVISVAIRLRDRDGDDPYGRIDPNNMTGNISVLVLSSNTFDATEIDVPSIEFGPGKAVPLSSKLVPAKSSSKTQADEREEWEIIRDNLGGDNGGYPKLQNLLLTFDLKSVGLKCVLDKALFLSGKIKSGEAIMGGVSTDTLGCDVRNPPRR
jgi:hypothetical protein